MNKISRVFLFSIFFIIAFNAPVFYLKADFLDAFYKTLILELLILIPITTIVFYLVSSIRHLGTIILALFCFLGAISNFFIFSFKKSFDAGVFEDILSVEFGLVMEYMNLHIFFTSLIVAILLIYFLARYIVNIKFDGWKIFISSILMTIGALLSIYAASPNHPIKAVIPQYMPFSFFYYAEKYIQNYKYHSELAKNKVDLSKKYDFEFIPSNDRDDLIVVFIIGESMRGDLISKDNMPYLFARENLIRFTQARSSATSTRISLPYMLTSATPPNIKQSLSEKSIISIFKSLNFATSWIGDQGLFGAYETTFASIAMEADHVVSKKELQKTFTDRVICDECLMPFFSNRLEGTGENKFFVMHFMGSHWNFEERVSEGYMKKFLPHCTKPIHNSCSHEEIMNSYFDTLSYSDEVLDQILSALEDKNAIVFYASDHGFSLGEDGYFGNAYVGPNVPKEQLDIAMFAWASRKFISNNPEKFNSLKSKALLPVSHDNIFHSILSCAGVKSDYIDKNLDLCKF